MSQSVVGRVSACQTAFQGSDRKAVALVFGATGSIGSEFVKEFVSIEELFVVAIARDSKRLNRLNTKIYEDKVDDLYRNFRYVTLDASEPAECVFFFEQCRQHALNIRYVVFAAGGLRADDEFDSVSESVDWHARSNLFTRITPYEALRREWRIDRSTVVLVVGSESVRWELNDERLEHEIGYANSMRNVKAWCDAMQQSHSRGCFRHLPYPLVEGGIAIYLKRKGLVSDDAKLPTAAEIVRGTMEDLASEFLVTFSVL